MYSFSCHDRVAILRSSVNGLLEFSQEGHQLYFSSRYSDFKGCRVPHEHCKEMGVFSMWIMEKIEEMQWLSNYQKNVFSSVGNIVQRLTLSSCFCGMTTSSCHNDNLHANTISAHHRH
eukprot:9523047-Ditylum_brightwellii.AAC.1